MTRQGVTDCRERRWEPVELKDGQRQEKQAATASTPDADGTGSGSLLDSILSTLLEEPPRDVWVAAALPPHRMTR